MPCAEILRKSPSEGGRGGGGVELKHRHADVAAASCSFWRDVTSTVTTQSLLASLARWCQTPQPALQASPTVCYCIIRHSLDSRIEVFSRHTSSIALCHPKDLQCNTVIWYLPCPALPCPALPCPACHQPSMPNPYLLCLILFGSAPPDPTMPCPMWPYCALPSSTSRSLPTIT